MPTFSRKGSETVTDAQAEQIQKLRFEGMGYKAIAAFLGLSRDQVRNYCKSHDYAGYGPAVTLNKQEQMDQGRLCRRCGKPIRRKGLGRKRKFCSDHCRRAWWAAHAEKALKHKKTCAYCGRQFTAPGRKSRKYCSHSCYIHDRFWRAEEGREMDKHPEPCEKVAYE